MKSYLVVIPAYNEGNCIAKVIKEIEKANPFADILVVNDGSRDNTSEIVKQMGIMLLDMPCNIGYGGAIQTGLRFANEYSYDYVITIDGDGQHDPYSVKNLMDTMSREAADVVIGSRFIEGSYKMSPVRRIGAWLFAKIAQLYTKVNFTDPTSGYQLLNRKVFSYLSKGDNYPLDYPDVNLIMVLHKMNFRVTEAPVKMLEKPGGKSMHSGLKPVFYVLRMFLAIIMTLIRKEDKQ